MKWLLFFLAISLYAEDYGNGKNSWDSIIGTEEGDDVVAGNKWDKVDLKGGDDTLGIGDAPSSSATIDLGDGDDEAEIGDEWGTINLGAGDDKLVTGVEIRNIYGEDGNDEIEADDSLEDVYTTISLGNGDDKLVAKDFWSKVDAGDGDDEIEVGNGSENINLGDGENSLKIGDAHESRYSLIVGGDDKDTISAGNYWSKIDSGSGNDEVSMIDGTELIILGDGDDIATIGDAQSGKYAKIEGGDGDDKIYAGNDFYNISLGDGDDILGIGDSITSNSVITAGDGDDEVCFGAYWNSVDGGLGNDTAIFQKEESEYTDTSRWGLTFYTENSSGFETKIVNFENIEFGGSCDGSEEVASQTYNCAYSSGQEIVETTCDGTGGGFTADTEVVEVGDEIRTIDEITTISTGTYYYGKLTINADVKISGDVKIYTDILHISAGVQINCGGNPDSLHISTNTNNFIWNKEVHVSGTIFVNSNLQIKKDTSLNGLIVTTDKMTGIPYLSAGNGNCEADEVVEEEENLESGIEVTDVDTLIYVNAGSSETIDTKFETGLEKSWEIGVVEITNQDSTPGDISYISYDSALLSSLGLTVEEFTGNGQIIFSGKSLPNSSWEELFKSVKFVTEATDLDDTKKVTFTLKNSESGYDLQLGNVPPKFIEGNPYEYETRTSLTASLSQWEDENVEMSSVNSYGSTNVFSVANQYRSTISEGTYVGQNIASYGTDLSYHVSTGLGVTSGQIQWRQDSSKPDGGVAEKIEIEFSKPITDIRVGFTGLGPRFIDSANAVFEFYYKDVLVRARGQLDRSSDFDGDGMVATNIATTNLIVDKMIFTILIEGDNKSLANYSVRYIVGNYTDTEKSFSKSYIVQIIEKTFTKVGESIQTQILGDSFDLNISMFDGSGNLKTYSGNVEIQFGSEIQTLEFSKESFKTASFTTSEIGKEFQIYATTIYGTFYSDVFAVRPKEFQIFAVPEELSENETFTLSILATDSNGALVQDFEETLDLNSTISLSGISEIEFISGKFEAETSFLGNGDANLSISETLGNEFAKIDENDTSEEKRLIESGNLNLEILQEIPESGNGFVVSDGLAYLIEKSPLFGGATRFDITLQVDGNLSKNGVLLNYYVGNSDEVKIYTDSGEIKVAIGYHSTFKTFPIPETSDVNTVRFIWENGNLDFYFNGKFIGNQIFKTGYTIEENGVLLLGQENDDSSGFDIDEAFVGIYKYIKIETDINSSEWDMSGIGENAIYSDTHTLEPFGNIWRESDGSSISPETLNSPTLSSCSGVYISKNETFGGEVVEDGNITLFFETATDGTLLEWGNLKLEFQKSVLSLEVGSGSRELFEVSEGNLSLHLELLPKYGLARVWANEVLESVEVASSFGEFESGSATFGKNFESTFYYAQIGDTIWDLENCGGTSEEETEEELETSSEYNFKIAEPGKDLIDTKIAGKKFNIQIEVFDSNGSTAKDFDRDVNISVNGKVWGEISIKNGKSLEHFTITDVNRSTYFQIWNSKSDNFAIRPKEFEISIGDSLTSGDEFSLSISALDENGDPTKYNHDVNITIADTKGCSEAESFEVTLQDGIFQENISYLEVGEVEITVSEVSGDLYAKIDGDEVISGDSAETTFHPAKFLVSAELSNFDGNYTYFANEVWEMGGDINFSFYSKNSLGDTTENFSSECYAEDINFTTTFVTSENPPEMISWGDTNGTISKSSFTLGVAKQGAKVNFERKSNKPLNLVQVLEASVETTPYPTESNSSGTISFLYSRLMAGEGDDKKAESQILVEYVFEVYCSQNPEQFGERKFSKEWCEHLEANESKFQISMIPRSDDISVNEKELTLNSTHSVNREYAINLYPPLYMIYSYFEENATFSVFNVEFHIYEEDSEVETSGESIQIEKIYLPKDRRVEW